MLIKIKDICVQFGNKKILKNISLNIPEGTVTAIIGPSGAGKSTLLRTLNLLEIPSHGSIEIDGVVANAGNINKKTIHKIRNKSTMVFQQFNLFNNLTALENVASPLILNHILSIDDAIKKSKKLLKEIGLDEIENQYPSTLSGGQKQRVSIARAISVKPKVLLLDEPTSALDPEHVKGVLNTITSLAEQNITMVIVTHEINFAKKVADQVAFVENGEILILDTVKNIFSSKNNRINSFVNSLESN
ncbi:amino acid ABC transporter ATP-binding protein [Liquorilactobacillus ghanensis]|uniref:amino acid ABC transporter ATP-binding protein n=1 Tax=Liquorilactobacillus ghanensis TaxID=399370 RepID=UPI0039E7447B